MQLDTSSIFNDPPLRLSAFALKFLNVEFFLSCTIPLTPSHV
jgi:hypothetical protein